jgi:general secretion pathway protein B
MSFILDALKKSESDRQRQNGPALFEVRVAPPRTRLPLWAIAIALLLVVNLGIVMWMLLRHQGHPTPPAPATGALTAAPPAATAGPPTGAAGTSVPVVAASAPAGAGVATPSAPAAASSSAAPAATPAATPAAPPAAPATAPTVGQGSTSGAPEASNPEDYAPAEETFSTGLGNRVRRGTASGVPLYQDVNATPGAQLPQLRLDLHVFAARPQDRFVMINMHKLREGDTLPEGVHVESITPEGAVLSFNGWKFLLPRD